MSHSLLSPSGAPRYMRCPGSVLRCLNLEDKDTDYNKLGTYAHDIANYCLKSDTVAEAITNGMPVEPEMVEAVNRYLNDVRTMSAGAIYDDSEVELDMSDVLGVEDEKGTADRLAVVEIPHGLELQVHDLKYGKGVPVSAEGNEQTRSYGLGSLRAMLLVFPDIVQVRMVIHQPRLNSLTEEVLTVEALEAFGQELRAKAQRIVEIIAVGQAEDTDFCAGEKQCKFCLAKGNCTYLRDHALAQIADQFDDLTADGVCNTVNAAIDAVPTKSGEELAALLPNLGLVRLWAKAVDDYALSEALAGRSVPGYKLVKGRSNRCWVDESVAEATLKSMRVKKEEMYTFSLISAPQAGKLFKPSKRKWQRIQSLIHKPEGSPTLVPESDKRPAVVFNVSTAEDFDNDPDFSDLI